MAKSEISVFLKNLAGDTIIVEVDPYKDTEEIASFFRSVVHNEFPDLQSIKFSRMVDPSDLRNPLLQEGETVMFFVDDSLESKILNKILDKPVNTSFKDIQQLTNDVKQEIEEEIGGMVRNDRNKAVNKLITTLLKNDQFNQWKANNTRKYNYQLYNEFMSMLTDLRYNRNLKQRVSHILFARSPTKDWKLSVNQFTAQFNQIVDDIMRAGLAGSFTKEEIAEEVATIILQESIMYHYRNINTNTFDTFRFLIEEIGADPYAPMDNRYGNLDKYLNFVEAVEYILQHNEKELTPKSKSILRDILDMIRDRNKSSYLFGCKRRNKKVKKSAKKSIKRNKSKRSGRKKSLKKSIKKGKKSPKKSVKKSLKKSRTLKRRV